MRKIAKVSGLCCANCAAKLEKSLQKIDGVNFCQLNFMAQRVTFDIDEEKLESAINEIKRVTKKMEPNAVYKGI